MFMKDFLGGFDFLSKKRKKKLWNDFVEYG